MKAKVAVILSLLLISPVSADLYNVIDLGTLSGTYAPFSAFLRLAWLGS